MRHDGRLTTARRIAWELTHGPLPRSTRVRACPSDPTCVRADHLSIIEPPQRLITPSKRRRRGEGSLRQVKPGVWQATVTAASPTGPSQRVSRTIRGDRATAETALAVLRAEHHAPPSNLDVVIELYFQHLTDAGRTPQTLRRYRQLWRTWLSPVIGKVHPNDLRPRHVERALSAMAAAGQSERSIHQAAVVLNSALAWALTNNLVPLNPVPRSRLPYGTQIAASRQRP